MVENIITSLLAFVSTNIDDIFILMLFYGRRNQKSINIVLGQYLGIGTLVLVSFVGALPGPPPRGCPLPGSIWEYYYPAGIVCIGYFYSMGKQVFSLVL